MGIRSRACGGMRPRAGRPARSATTRTPRRGSGPPAGREPIRTVDGGRERCQEAQDGTAPTTKDVRPQDPVDGGQRGVEVRDVHERQLAGDEVERPIGQFGELLRVRFQIGDAERLLRLVPAAAATCRGSGRLRSPRRRPLRGRGWRRPARSRRRGRAARRCHRRGRGWWRPRGRARSSRPKLERRRRTDPRCPSHALGIGTIRPGSARYLRAATDLEAWMPNEVLGDRLQRLRAGSVEVLVQIPAVGLAGRVVRSDHPDPSLGLHGVVADDGSEALFALVGLRPRLPSRPAGSACRGSPPPIPRARTGAVRKDPRHRRHPSGLPAAGVPAAPPPHAVRGRMTGNDERLATNRRPALHFTADRGWINDPHGVTFRDGSVHLFHQAVPDSTAWAPAISWGHATSPDLLAWQQQPPALVPGTGTTAAGPAASAPRRWTPTPAMYYTSVSLANVGSRRRPHRQADRRRLARVAQRSRRPAHHPSGRRCASSVTRTCSGTATAGACSSAPATPTDGRRSSATARRIRSTGPPKDPSWRASGPARPMPGTGLGMPSTPARRRPPRPVVSVLAGGAGRDVLVAAGSYVAGRMHVDGTGHSSPTARATTPPRPSWTPTGCPA